MRIMQLRRSVLVRVVNYALLLHNNIIFGEVILCILVQKSSSDEHHKALIEFLKG